MTLLTFQFDSWKQKMETIGDCDREPTESLVSGYDDGTAGVQELVPSIRNRFGNQRPRIVAEPRACFETCRGWKVSVGCQERGQGFSGAGKCLDKVALVFQVQVALSGNWIGSIQDDGHSCQDGGRAPLEVLLLMQQLSSDPVMSHFSPANEGWWIPGS